jgi:AraC-like DNA-binding protein/mannose-6-phosphate isomerase-like protein (cupin superfamily)
MHHRRPHWVNAYPLVQRAINAEGVTTIPFDPTFPIHVGFHIYAGPCSVRTRRHEHLELIYIYSGRTNIQVHDRSFRMKPGDLIVLGSNLYHRILNNPKTQVKIVSLNFRPEIIRGSEPSADAEQYLSPFICHDPTFPHMISASSKLPRRALELILDMHRRLPALTSLERLAVKTHMKMLLMLLVEYYRVYLRGHKILDRRERDVGRLRSLFQFLEQNFGQQIKVADAARLCAMSSSHFMRFFKTVTGESFLAYLNNFRITKAQTLLATTEESVGDISDKLAFCSQSHFGKVFLARVGMPPLAYRRRFERIGQLEEANAPHLSNGRCDSSTVRRAANISVLQPSLGRSL